MKAFLTIILTIGFIKQVSAQCPQPCLPDEVCQPFNDIFDVNVSPPVTISGFECACNRTIYDTPDFVNLLVQQSVSCGPGQFSINVTQCLGRKMTDFGIILPDDNRRQNPCLIREVSTQFGIATYSFNFTSSDPNCVSDLSLNSTHVTTSADVYFDCEPVKGIIYCNNISINYTCSYPLQYNMTLDGPVMPYTSSISITVTGYGTFNIIIQLFSDQDYLAPYTANDMLNPIKVATTLYGKAILVGADQSKFSLSLESFYATPSNNPNDSVQFLYIFERCVLKSAHITTNGNQLLVLFSIAVIKFDIYDSLYFHAVFNICSGTCVQVCPYKAVRVDNVVASSKHLLGPLSPTDERSGSGTCVSLPCTWKMWTLLALLMISVM